MRRIHEEVAAETGFERGLLFPTHWNGIPFPVVNRRPDELMVPAEPPRHPGNVAQFLGEHTNQPDRLLFALKERHPDTTQFTVLQKDHTRPPLGHYAIKRFLNNGRDGTITIFRTGRNP